VNTFADLFSVKPQLRHGAGAVMNAKKKRVLLVDDDQQVLDCLQIALGERGYEVLLAHDGAEGLMRAERDAPDLIVLDMMMPKRSGIAVLDRLRRHHKSGPRIIMMTANEERRHREFAESRGVDAYLKKPFDVGEFLTVVDALFKTSDPESTPTA
jgi:DNA-binding response OmpR family regulator